MDFRSFVAVTCAFLTALPISAATVPVEVSTPSVEASAQQLKNELTQTLQQEGTQSIASFLRQKAGQGYTLLPLRSYFLEKNHGQPELVDVPIPKNGQFEIDFANRQLAEADLDFMKYRGVVDPKLKLNEPLPNQALQYQAWVGWRTRIFPFFGAASAILQGGLGHLSRSGAQIASAAGQALAVFGLEVNFSIFSRHWNKLWSKDKPLIPGPYDQIAGEASRAARLLGRLSFATKNVTQAHMWNFLVNFGYVLILFGVSNAAFGAFGLPHSSALATIGKAADVGAIGFLGFGIPQVLLGKSFARGEISELLRFQLECLIVGWGAFWRDVAAAPHLWLVGNVMLYSLALFVTAPLLTKTFSSRRYNRKTARMFAANDEAYRLGQSSCGELLNIKKDDRMGDFYDVAPFSKQQSVGSFLKQTYRNVTSRFRAGR